MGDILLSRQFLMRFMELAHPTRQNRTWQNKAGAVRQIGCCCCHLSMDQVHLACCQPLFACPSALGCGPWAMGLGSGLWAQGSVVSFHIYTNVFLCYGSGQVDLSSPPAVRCILPCSSAIGTMKYLWVSSAFKDNYL